MAIKHMRALKENFAVALRQWGLPRLEKEMRKMKAMRTELPEVWELCTACGKIKALANRCKACREAKANKRIEKQKWRSRQRFQQAMSNS